MDRSQMATNRLLLVHIRNFTLLNFLISISHPQKHNCWFCNTCIFKIPNINLFIATNMRLSRATEDLLNFLSASDGPKFIYWTIMKILYVHPSDWIISINLTIRTSVTTGSTHIESDMGIISGTHTYISKLHTMSLIVFALVQNFYFKDLNSLLQNRQYIRLFHQNS